MRRGSFSFSEGAFNASMLRLPFIGILEKKSMSTYRRFYVEYIIDSAPELLFFKFTTKPFSVSTSIASNMDNKLPSIRHLQPSLKNLIPSTYSYIRTLQPNIWQPNLAFVHLELRRLAGNNPP